MAEILKRYSLDDIKETAAWLWEQIKDHKVITLNGNMGAGKTTLVSALCNHLGVTDTVSSPTFSIINEYNFKIDGIPEKIYHIDLYRLKNETEAVNAGVEECLYSGSYCIVEWAERARDIFPEETVDIYLYHEGTAYRSIEIERK